VSARTEPTTALGGQAPAASSASGQARASAFGSAPRPFGSVTSTWRVFAPPGACVTTVRSGGWAPAPVWPGAPIVALSFGA
jgi:hypothetical protein